MKKKPAKKKTVKKKPSDRTLRPGDLCYFVQKERRLRCQVVDSLLSAFPKMRNRGEPVLVPVTRTIRKTVNHLGLEAPGQAIREPKIRWIDRKLLRKLPPKKVDDAA